MSRFLKKVAKKMGAAPGTLIHVGERKIEKARISLFSYDQASFTCRDCQSVDELPDIGAEPATTAWLNVDGLHDVALIEAIGSRFGIHPLTLEDILQTGQRPKAELFDAYMYIVLKMIQYDEKDRVLTSEQISFVIFPGVLISFQESIGDVFSGVRERIQRGKGRIRGHQCDYLAYALIDAIVDHYFVILEKLGQQVESLELELTDSPDQIALRHIHELRHELI